MDEHKEESASASTAMNASDTVTETKLVAVVDGEKTQVAGTANIEVQAPDQLEGRSLGEEVVVEEVGSANGADIMVGAMDSDIYIDGVCIHDFGDGDKGNLNGEAATSRDKSMEVGLEIKAKALDGETGLVGDSGSDGTRVSAVEDSNLGTDIEVEVSIGVEEPIDKEKLVKHGASGREVSGGLGRSDVVDAKTSKEVKVEDTEPHSVVIESVAAAAISLTEGSVVEETPIVVEEVEAVTRGEILERVLLTGAEKSCNFMATDAADSYQFGISKNEASDQRVENGETTLGAFVAETQVVEKFELTDKLLDQAKDTDGSGGDVLQETEKQEVDLLHDEVRAPGSKIVGATSSTMVKELTATVNVVEEDVNSNEDLNPQAVAAVSDPIDGTSGDNGLEKRLVTDALGDNLARNDLQGLVTSSKRDSISTKVDSIANATSESMEEKTQATAEGEFQLMDNKEVTCPNIEDSKSSHQPTQIIVDGEAMVTMINMLPNSREDLMFSTEECLDQSITCNSAMMHSNVEPDIKTDTQIPDVQKAGLLEQKVTAAEHQVMIDTANDSIENHSSSSVNLLTSYQSMQSVGETGQTNYQSLSDPDSEADKTKPTCGGIEMDVYSALSNNDSIVNSTNEVLEPAGKVLQSGPEECLEMSAAFDCTQSHSNIEQVKEVQDQVTPLKQFEEEGKLREADLDPETASVSTGTNIEVIDGGGSVMESYERTLNSTMELQSLDEGDQHLIIEEGLNENAAQQISDTDLGEGQGMTVEEQVLDAEQFGSCEEQEMEVDEHNTGTEQPKIAEDRTVKESALKFGSTGNAIHARYDLFLEDEGEFSVYDLVWGKVRSHPWWPGQILDPSIASEKAMKYHKKDCFLVAYFGDRTFAWNEAALLKPFRSHFHQVEKQSTSESFQNAVNCALEEVARRVELGLACSCLPKDIYDRIRFQVVENAGIQEESTRIDGLAKFASCDAFEPEKLLEYIKELACCPTDGADCLELITAKSQLLAFYRFRGSTQLPEFVFCGDVLERADGLEFQGEGTEYESPVCRNDGGSLPDQETLQTQSSCHKRKHNLKDSVHARRKERSLTELTGEPWDSLDDEIGSDEKAGMNIVSSPSGKKQKGSESFASDSATPEGRKTISLAQVSLPKPSFKIGDCIRRVASQMTGSPSILKSNSQKVDGSSDGLVGDRFDVSIKLSEDSEVKTMIVPTEYSSTDEFLAQLHLAASDPLKRHSFLNIIVSFFTDFRNSVIVDQDDKLGVKRRKAYTFGGSPATFEFEDMNDTYWTDRVIQNGSEEQPSRKNRKRENQVVSGDPDKSLHESNSRKRYSDGYSDLSAEKPTGYVDENAPAELVMHFPVVDSVPSETNLNKMFRCFGPISESKTEVDKDTNRARVVFKRCSDAEAAYGSAPKFNIFGSMLVNYHLNYTISVPFKTVPIATTNGVEDATLFLEY